MVLTWPLLQQNRILIYQKSMELFELLSHIEERKTFKLQLKGMPVVFFKLLYQLLFFLSKAFNQWPKMNDSISKLFFTQHTLFLDTCITYNDDDENNLTNLNLTNQIVSHKKISILPITFQTSKFLFSPSYPSPFFRPTLLFFLLIPSNPTSLLQRLDSHQICPKIFITLT